MAVFKTIFIALFIGVLCLVAGGYYMAQELSAPLKLDSPQLITIEKGSSAHQVVAKLEQRDALPVNTLVIKLGMKAGMLSSGVKAGTYWLEPGMNLEAALERFSQADEAQFSVSLIEGLTLAQWQQSLQQHPNIKDDLTADTLSQLKAKWQKTFSVAPLSLEGLFLADTYHFTHNTRASVILRRAMQAMSDYLTSQWQQRAVNLPYDSPYEALILASIIEKETAVPAERGEIAGVFVNRLRSDMRLQTDPTVIYGIGEAFDGNITRTHLRQKNAYNTYVIKGLPPTPIAMAGRAAVTAALQPAGTDALYFVAKGDGSHQFSQTLQQHNAAVRKYQLQNR